MYNGAELCRDNSHGKSTELDGWLDPDVAEVDRWLDQAGRVCAVRGNHDLADPHGFFRRANDVTGRVMRLGDNLLVAGLGWHGERYYELPGESEMLPVCESVRRQLRRLATARDRVALITHYPPKLPRLYSCRIPEVGWWHACTLALVDEVSPDLVVQGHVHELAGDIAELTTRVGKTLLINPGKRGMTVSLDTARRHVEVLSVL